MKPYLLGLCAVGLSACAQQAAEVDAQTSRHTVAPYVELTHPDWSRDAVIYQVNTRQYSEAGTFDAVRADLPRLKALGVDILWFMPIHEIGEVKRKGTLGSPYAVKDYYSVNPEFGTPEDFDRLVAAIHDADMHIILDWVANHTAWDNALAEDHPDWYERDWKGDFRPTPWWDWSDIIDLDFSRPEVREYMHDAMRHWVSEHDIDGFRADVAGYVPLDFWEVVRADLDTIKPVFMLAEWQTRDLHARAFDATYAWEWKEGMQAIARGEADTGALYGYYSGNESAWPVDAMRMTYTANHDQNSWDGTAPAIYGDAYRAAIALQFTGEGIPLIYNGQEAFNEKRLEFFEKDPIAWRDHPIGDLFARLVQFKTDNPALHNGAWGGRTTKVENSNPSKVFGFIRRKDGNRVVGIFNLSDAAQDFALTDANAVGEYADLNGAPVTLMEGETMTLNPWEFWVLSAN